MAHDSPEDHHGMFVQAVFDGPLPARSEQPMRPGSIPPPFSSEPPRAVIDAADDRTKVVRLGAWCDHTDRPGSFDVSEFALLADGRCLTLHANERGWSGSVDPDDPWRHESVESVERDVRTLVEPDGDPDVDDSTIDEHPWEWLVDLIAAHGVRTTAAHLRSVSYDVELSERVVAQLTAEP